MDSATLKQYLPHCVNFCDSQWYRVAVEPNDLISITEILRSKLQMHSLMDITCVDYPHKSKRFNLVYHFLNMRDNIRIFLELSVAENENLASIHNEFTAATWYEREIYDMYGIPFTGMADKRRMLMDEDFDGHPLRKDFPVMGYIEVRYDIAKQEVSEYPVDLEQDYRDLNFLSPWRGPQIKVEEDKGN